MYPQPLQPVSGGTVSPARVLAAASGGVALLGFAATLLPVLTINLIDLDKQLNHHSYERNYHPGTATASFGYYDWISTSLPAVGLIPVVFAIAAAAGLLQAVRGTSRNAQAVTMFLALGAVLTVALTTIRPAATVQLTGELASSASATGDIDVNAASDAVSVQPSVALTAVALLVVVGLNAWPLLANRS